MVLGGDGAGEQVRDLCQRVHFKNDIISSGGNILLAQGEMILLAQGEIRDQACLLFFDGKTVIPVYPFQLCSWTPSQNRNHSERSHLHCLSMTTRAISSVEVWKEAEAPVENTDEIQKVLPPTLGHYSLFLPLPESIFPFILLRIGSISGS